MYVKHIPQHNNLSPTSLLITLTVFVAGATNSPINKHRPEVNLGRTHAPNETVYTQLLIEMDNNGHIGIVNPKMKIC